MSHVTGTVQPASITIGPASGTPPTTPGVWAVDFAYSQAPGGTKLVILHFSAVDLPGGNRLEVDLGYGMDVFTSGSGATFWTRPINVYKVPGGVVPIRYIAVGAPAGSAHLDQYGRGERHAGLPGHNSFSNSDPFLGDPAYAEPQYDDFWFCTGPPKWENVACVTATGDVRAVVSRSVGMIVSVEGTDVSTCSVTLVDADKVISAGHCHTPAEALGSSVTFDYRLECNGARPAGYDARFYKVAEVLSHHNDAVGDFSLLRLTEPVVGIPPIQMRPDLPAVGETVFGVHHPNGAPKKLSPLHPGFATISAGTSGVISVPSGFHVSGGSSGSGLFDTAGRIVGVLSNGNPCGRGGVTPTDLSYFPIASVLKAIAPTPAPAVTRDVMVVFDRSGSMDEPDVVGRRKIDAARDAASLFVQLVKSSVGNRVGLASFSTSASIPVDFALQAVDPAHKIALVGAAPYAAGLVGGLAPGGATSIGAGLEQARQQFPVPGANPRAILLLTDGMQNTPPLVRDVDPGLVGIAVHAIGFGRDSNIDGALLATLTAAHAGQYTRAESGLALEKFFSHAFGNIFEAGIISDPEYDLARGETKGAPLAFPICGEDAVTIVLGWDRVDASLMPLVTTPSGTIVTTATPGVEADEGRTWSFIRIALPVGAERNGEWSVTPARPGWDGELVGETPPLRYFINVIPTGGPRLELVSARRIFYTGERINPMVRLRNADGSWPDDVTVELVAERPTVSLGLLLAREKLHSPTDSSGDTIPARQATTAALEQAAAGPLIPVVTEVVTLSDAPEDTGGRFEPAATFGRQLDQLTATDGHCQLRFKATYGGPGCSAARELLATLLVEVGIDPAHSQPTVVDNGPRPDGQHEGTLTVTPADRFGNLLGPGRPNAMTVTGVAGTTITGPPHDNGDGSYSVPVVWDPAAGGPGIVVNQPDRPPVTIGTGPTGSGSFPWWLIVLLLVVLVVILLILLLT